MSTLSEPTSAAITVTGLSKTFKLPHEKNNSVKGALIGLLRNRRNYELQEALKAVSFAVEPGEFFGIVGRNGSGKSTLLKLLAGIYTPTAGGLEVKGRLTPFIELGVGFNPELTGRENVFLNGALLGFDRKQMQRMYKDIVDFAELERFMDQKLKNYSSGMQVRLAFSIAIRAKSDILLIDEVLAVGDMDFQRKCYRYFFDLKRKKQTVILVTHDMSVVRRFCDRCLLLNDGEVIKVDKPDAVANMYEMLNLRRAEPRLTKENEEVVYKQHEGDRAATIEKVETFNAKTGRAQNTFDAQEKIGCRIIYRAHQDVAHPALGFIFQDAQDATVFATNNMINNLQTKSVKKGDQIILEVVVDNIFTDGEYSVTCAIESEDLTIIHDRIEHLHTFMIGGHKLPHATIHPSHQFKVSYTAKASKSAKE